MISIIVPVCNVADYIDDCLSSILHSTYEDIEVIVVDDGSTDNSGAICDKYASQYARCKVLHTPNKGVTAARNMGLSESKGEYIAFVDGDDFVHPKMYEYLYQVLSEHPEADYSICDYFRSPKGMSGQIKECRSYETAPKVVLSQSVIAKRLFGTCLENDFLYLVVWNKLYRRAVIEGIRFMGDGAQDIDFNVRLLPKVQKTVLVEEKLYYWVQRPNSYLHQRLTKRSVDRVDVYDRMYNTLYSLDHTYADYCLEKYCKIMLNLKRMSRGTDLEDYTKNKMKPYLKPYMKKLLFCSSIPFHSRFVICCFNLCPHLYSLYIYYMARRGGME